MAKKRRAARGEPTPTAEYIDADGSVLRLRESLTPETIRTIKRAPMGAAASADDAWRRRAELLFERLAVSWEIAGLPLDDQKLLLARYRMADSGTQRWVQRTIANHVDRHLPGLRD